MLVLVFFVDSVSSSMKIDGKSIILYFSFKDVKERCNLYGNMVIMIVPVYHRVAH